MKYVVVAFYKFFPWLDYASAKEWLLSLLQLHEIKGTLILASEGINGALAGNKANMDNFIHTLRQETKFKDITLKISHSTFNPFDKAKVKLRKEIVTLGIDNINIHASHGGHIDPSDWNSLITQPEVLLVDVRNNYEVHLGTFKGAINPRIENFRDFPKFAQQHLMQYKNKKIAMHCTGGIRCEKSTVYLQQIGFDKVYQLKGGILNYLQNISPINSLWEGKCFVFDNRVAIDHNLRELIPGSIDLQWKNKHRRMLATCSTIT